MDVRLEIPDSVAQAIRLPESDLRGGLLVELALALYSRGILGLGKARELAELPALEFGRLLGERGIPRQYSEGDLADDLRYAGRQWHLSSLTDAIHDLRSKLGFFVSAELEERLRLEAGE